MPIRTWLIVTGFLGASVALAPGQLSVRAVPLPPGSFLWAEGVPPSGATQNSPASGIVDFWDPTGVTREAGWLSGVGVIEPIGRVGPHQVLVHQKGGGAPGFYLADSESGTARLVVAGEREDCLHYWNGWLSLRYRISPTHSGFGVRTYDLRAGTEPISGGSEGFLACLAAREGSLLLVGASPAKPGELFLGAPATGKVPLAPGAYAGLRRGYGCPAEFSPQGSAVATMVPPGDDVSGWRLVVHATGDGSTLRTFAIPIPPCHHLLPQKPAPDFRWLSEDSVQWEEILITDDRVGSFSWQKRWSVGNLESGKLTSLRAVSHLASLRPDPELGPCDPTLAVARGRFELRDSALFVPPNERPLWSLRWINSGSQRHPVRVSPCGEYAAGLVGDPNRAILHFAQARDGSIHPLVSAESPRFGWLSAP